MVDLGTLGGRDSHVAAISETGQVVGRSQTSAGTYHAFSWTSSTGIVDIGTLGGEESDATAVNALGQVVGSSLTATPPCPHPDDECHAPNHAFLWTAAGGMRDLGTLGCGADCLSYSEAVAVNGRGQVVGRSDAPDASYRAFSWTTAGGMVNLGALNQSDDAVFPYATNVHGQVVGQEVTDDDSSATVYAFSWTATGGMINLGTLGGHQTFARAVNAGGQVVGFGLTADGAVRAFVWTAARGMVDLGALAGSAHSVAIAISDSGRIVGSSAVGDVTRATVWQLASPRSGR
jgi:probable HAF family extracellular repeat protein